MKNKILLMPGIAAVALLAIAASPAYVTKSANGNAASPASLILPADPYTQIRVVNVNYSTDTNNSVLSFASGTTAYSIQATNQATSSTTNLINSTNGLSVGATLVLQHSGVCYSATEASWNSGTNVSIYGLTNVVLNSGGWGVATTVGDSVYLMGTATTFAAAAASSGTTTSAAANGEAIYVAAYQGRPVSVTLTPALVTNKLNNVVAHYD